jgi:hypothetical protein
MRLRYLYNHSTERFPVSLPLAEPFERNSQHYYLQNQGKAYPMGKAYESGLIYHLCLQWQQQS